MYEMSSKVYGMVLLRIFVSIDGMLINFSVFRQRKKKQKRKKNQSPLQVNRFCLSFALSLLKWNLSCSRYKRCVQRLDILNILGHYRHSLCLTWVIIRTRIHWCKPAGIKIDFKSYWSECGKNRLMNIHEANDATFVILWICCEKRVNFAYISHTQ